MGKVGGDHWRSSSASPLLKQTPLEHMTQDCVQRVLSKHKTSSFCDNNDADLIILEKGQSKVLHFARSII